MGKTLSSVDCGVEDKYDTGVECSIQFTQVMVH